MDDTGNPVLFWVGPVRQSPLRAEPADLGVRVELLLAEDRMGKAKGDHPTGEPENFPVFLEAAPVIPARFVILAVGVVVAALRPAKFVSAEQHRDPARDQKG